jgi:hypothetical protein
LYLGYILYMICFICTEVPITDCQKPSAEEIMRDEFPGYIIHNVPANGDCLFTAIAHQLSLGTGKEPVSSMKIRQDLITYVETHASIYKDVAAAGWYKSYVL